VAEVKPFRALRYSERAGRLADLVAPPYDVISPAEREHYLARSPFNVVHLTLPDSEEEAAGAYGDWLERGILRDEQVGVWALAQEYVGPDGVARRREGLVASLQVEPYASRVVLPHERTHARVKEERLRLLRATRVQLEPIFLLYDGPAPAAPPERAPELSAEGSHLWRLEDSAAVARAFEDKQLLIADGHHRYETAVAFHQGEGTPESAQMLVVLVSTEDPGLEIFPTHRVFAARRELPGDRASIDDPLAALAELNGGGPAVVEVTSDGAAIVRGEPGLLDVQLVDTLGHEGLSYTPDAGEAVGLVRGGEAAVAYLMRPTRIEDVFAAARRGEVLPPKTTYFFPKLISGLVFHPLG
jgi:uncharacterized protein (DUF1015 family)